MLTNSELSTSVKAFITLLSPVPIPGPERLSTSLPTLPSTVPPSTTLIARLVSRTWPSTTHLGPSKTPRVTSTLPRITPLCPRCYCSWVSRKTVSSMTPKTLSDVVDTPIATMSYSSRVKMQQKPVLQCLNHDLWSTISTPFVGMSDKTTHGFPSHPSASPFPAPRSSHFLSPTGGNPRSDQKPCGCLESLRTHFSSIHGCSGSAQ